MLQNVKTVIEDPLNNNRLVDSANNVKSQTKSLNDLNRKYIPISRSTKS